MSILVNIEIKINHSSEMGVKLKGVRKMKKNFEKFIEEVKSCEDIEELESSCEMMDSYLERGIFNRYQKEMFLIVYKEVEAKIITETIYQKNPENFNYLRLINIVRNANDVLRGNIESLTRYAQNIDRQLKSQQKFA